LYWKRRDVSVAAEALADDCRGTADYIRRMDTMVSAISLAELGALIGDPARANMLSALMSGQALTASELAWHAGVTASTASEHLGKLAAAGLLSLHPQGRHRYYGLASPVVAHMLEAMGTLAATHLPPRYRPRSPIDNALRNARTCYDHLAGRLGVAVTDALLARNLIALAPDGGVATRRGERFFAEFGIDLAQASRLRRCFCRACLDWSERRPHLAGTLGARIAQRCFDLGWIARMKDTRAVAITPSGSSGFHDLFAIRFEPTPLAGSGRATYGQRAPKSSAA
jgi:DNA-binding transcriptional ArsR family regulator